MAALKLWTGTEWVVVSSGATGATGPTGAPGSVWYSGTGAPSGALGKVTDWYLDDGNGDVHEKTGESTWTLRDNITGPTGPVLNAYSQPNEPVGAIDGDVWYDTDDPAPASVYSQVWKPIIDNPLTSLADITSGSGTWTLVGGYLNQSDTGGSPLPRRAQLNAPVTRAFMSVKCDIKINSTGATAAWRGGLLLGYAGGNSVSGQVVYIGTSNSGSTWFISAERDASVFQAQNAFSLPYTVGTWVTLGIMQTTAGIEVYIDDVFYGTISTGAAPITTAIKYLGFYTYDANVSFRDYKMWGAASGWESPSLVSIGDTLDPPTTDTPPANPSVYDYEFNATTTSLPSGWSWVNQGTSTYSEQYGAGVISYPASAVNAVRMLTRSIPATMPWTATAKFSCADRKGNWLRFGLAIRDSVSGKLFSFHAMPSDTASAYTARIEAVKWTNPTTFTEVQAGFDLAATMSGPFYTLRVRRNSSTSYDFWMSVDNGYTFTRLLTASNLGGFITPDQIGIFVDSNTNAAGEMACHYFRVEE